MCFVACARTVVFHRLKAPNVRPLETRRLGPTDRPFRPFGPIPSVGPHSRWCHCRCAREGSPLDCALRDSLEAQWIPGGTEVARAYSAGLLLIHPPFIHPPSPGHWGVHESTPWLPLVFQSPPRTPTPSHMLNSPHTTHLISRTVSQISQRVESQLNESHPANFLPQFASIFHLESSYHFFEDEFC